MILEATNEVERIAPSSGVVTVWIPLLAGEHISSGDMIVDDKSDSNITYLQATIASGQNVFSWHSILDQQNSDEAGHQTTFN